MEIEQEIVGFNGEGEVILRYTLTNSVGAKVTLLNCGAAVESIVLPDGSDMILSYPSHKEYQNDSLNMGKCVGRVAGRIAKGRFKIDDIPHKLSSNEGTTHLNGGVSGFGAKLWQARSEVDMVVFSYVSNAGEEGYPSEFGVEVGYTWSDDCTLGITVVGEADGDTLVNIAPFLYFTIGNDVRLKINSDLRVPLDAKLLPKGEAESVDGTEYDFREYRDVKGEFDDYWMVSNYKAGAMNEICSLRSLESGIELNICSSQPALYFSSCNNIEGCGVNKSGEELCDGCAVLLSPMAVASEVPDNIILRAGMTYHHYTSYKFLKL